MAEEKKNKNDLIQKVFIGIFAFLAIFFVVSIKNSNTSYKDEIKTLEEEKVILEGKLEGKVDKDSILYYLSQQGDLNSFINQLNEVVDSFKNISYEESIDYSGFTVDSNIVILARRLSEKN